MYKIGKQCLYFNIHIYCVRRIFMNIYPEKSQQAGKKLGGFLSILLEKLSTRERMNKMIKENNMNEAHVILEEIKNARNEWINANMDFEYADDQEMVDYCIYKIKASEIRYEYFIRKAKEKGIRVAHLEKECIMPFVNKIRE